MKNLIEILGVIGLWGLGMITAIPGNWSSTCILGVALASSILMGVYGWWAIVERRGGDSHYFVMALLTVALTVISLALSAWQMPNGRNFLIGLLIAFLAVIAFFVFRTWKDSLAATNRGN